MYELIEDIAPMLGYIGDFSEVLVGAVRDGVDNAQLIAQAYDKRYGGTVG